MRTGARPCSHLVPTRAGHGPDPVRTRARLDPPDLCNRSTDTASWVRMKAHLLPVLLLSVLIFTASQLRAADTPPLPPRLEARLEQLDEKLQLTPEQKEKITAIWMQAVGKLDAGRDDDSFRQKRKNRRAWREAMTETRAQVRAVLTPEQQKIFDELRPSRPGKP